MLSFPHSPLGSPPTMPVRTSVYPSFSPDLEALARDRDAHVRRSTVPSRLPRPEPTTHAPGSYRGVAQTRASSERKPHTTTARSQTSRKSHDREGGASATRARSVASVSLLPSVFLGAQGHNVCQFLGPGYLSFIAHLDHTRILAVGDTYDMMHGAWQGARSTTHSFVAILLLLTNACCSFRNSARHLLPTTQPPPPHSQCQ